ncbi:Protein CBR-TSP-17 [Caenorhabditis briggsae]|uniref:Tetraspanin n=1 Tax=Caenorhabditis briggsae TaxID=6238 RepID=A8XJM8_CAEBR|nr:Protein CBR-TSP-17 [Caenorhabditis briggsae]CAP32854.1 Protein CBR-TSP-17 [Caenorhabditis briggsae]
MLLDPKRNYILDLVHFSENDPLLKASAYVSLVCGCAQLLVGFLGLCGAVNRSRFLLLMFVMFLICTFLADVAMGTLSLFYKDKFSNNYMEVYLKNLTANRYSRDRWVMPLMDTIQFYIYSLKENVREIVKSKYGVETDEPENRILTQFIDKLQFYHQCCGGEGPLDYKDSFWYITNTLRGTRSFVPPSCCKQAQAGRAWAPVPIDPMCITYRYLSSPYTTSVNTVGCSDRLMSWFNEQIWIFVGFGFGSALTMMLGISLSCCLISRIHIYHVIPEDY